MKKFYRIILTTITLFLLSACTLLPKHQQNNVNDSTIEMPPKEIETDWKIILTPLTEALLSNNSINPGTALLISDVQNKTNQYVPSSQLDDAIKSLLNNQTIFNIVDEEVVNFAKENLGIPLEDSNISRSKTLALARQINANMVLFTTINQIPVQPNTPANVSMELLLTSTGEIVWKGSTGDIVKNEKNG